MDTHLDSCVNAAHRHQGQTGVTLDDVYYSTITFQDVVQSASRLLPYEEVPVIRTRCDELVSRPKEIDC